MVSKISVHNRPWMRQDYALFFIVLNVNESIGNPAMQRLSKREPQAFVLPTLQVVFGVSCPMILTITEFPALSRAGPLHPCATLWFVHKTWNLPKEKASHPFPLPHSCLGVLWSSPGDLLPAPQGGWDVAVWDVAIAHKHGKKNRGGPITQSSHWEGCSLRCRELTRGCGHMGTGNIGRGVKPQNPGLSSSTVNFAICQWEPSNKHLETYLRWLHQNMWLFGAVGKQEPNSESNAAV